MGDRDEPTVKDRPRLNTPTIEIDGPGTKITEVEPPGISAFDKLPERFEAKGELGRGGMGRVDDAFDHALGRPVAIKHMLAQNEIDLARFEREAKITARLEHPGIVPIHDAGRSADGTPYYVMRRVDGQPLSELVEKHPLVERLKVVPNILAACDAVGFAHARGVVHRDIKPTNILVGPFGETLVIDWGLARELESRDVASPIAIPSDPQLTRAGTVAGTPGFMSPEQARGETVDARADVFALGATLFYALSGELPWRGGSTEMIDHVGAGRPPDWRRIPKEVPADLRAIVEKAMAADLAVRYPDASALAADLRRFTLGNLVAAYEYGVGARLLRFARRHRGAMVVALVSALVLAIVAVVSIRRVISERDAANAARALAETRQREARAAADRLLVRHASELVDDDPVGAIAALRQLPADSSSWPEAWAAASAAYLRGVPFGFVGSSEPSMVSIANDDRHAFSIGMQTGAILLIDLQTRTKRRLGMYGMPTKADWFDDEHIICGVKDNLLLIDIATGQSRALPMVKPWVWSNRTGLAVVQIDDKLFELTDVSGTPREIDSGVSEYTPSTDLKSALVVRNDKREFWFGGKTYTMPPADDAIARYTPIFLVRDRTVAILQGSVPAVWDLVDDQMVQRPKSPAVPNARALAISGNTVYVIDGDSLRNIDPRAIPTNMPIDLAYQQQNGFVLGQPDGAMVLMDEGGYFHLGKRTSRYQRIDRSNDGRFLIGATESGEILVWNLSRIRPRAIPIAHDQTPVALTEKALWVLSPGFGVLRIDLKTGARTLAISTVAALLDFFVAPDESWQAVFEGNKLIIARAGKVVLDQHAVMVGFGRHALLYVNEANELMQWRDGTVATVTPFPRPPTLIAAGDTFAIAAFDRELVRINLADKHEDRTTFPAEVLTLSTDEAGTTWIVSNAEGYRWDLGAPSPQKLALGDVPDSVLATETGAVFHGLRTFVKISRNGEVHVVPFASRWAGLLDGDRLGTITGQGSIAIVDVANNASFVVPIEHEAGYPLVLSPGMLGILYWHPATADLLVGILPIDVPSQPAELQRWLANITNAKPVLNSEAVAWP